MQYTVTVANSGASPYTGATFTDDLAGVLDDAAYSNNAAAAPDVGAVSFAGGGLTWTGDVPAAASPVPGTVAVTFTVTVSNPDTGNKILASTVSTSSPGSNCLGGSTDPRCAATVTVSQLAITFTANVGTTTPGGAVVFTSTLANTGKTPYFGISVATDSTGIADDATGNGDQTATAGTLSVGATGAVWTGDIPVGGTVTVTGSATVNNPDLGDQLLSATAVSAAPGNNCPSGGTDPACTAAVTVLTPALSVVKTADTTFALPGQTVTYTITVHNTGQTSYAGATVTDDLADVLDEAAYSGGAAATTGTVGYAGSTLTWTGDLAVGASVAITYPVAVNSPAAGGKLMTNTAVSPDPGSTCPPAAPGAGCTAAVPVLTPALTIAKTAGTATTVPGGTVHYTVTVTNTGQTPYTGAAFSDDLTGVLDDAAYNTDATVAAGPGVVSFASPVLTWTANLAVGGSATITYSVTVASPDTGDHILANTVTSATAGSNCASGSTDARCAVTVDVAQLAIGFTANVATTTPGGVVVFTSTIANTGQVPYSGISVATDATGIADDATGNGDQTATSGTLSVGSTGAVWTGDIPVGGTVTVTASATVNNPDTGDHHLTATAISAAPGSNCPAGGTDPACTVNVTVLTPALTITKTASTSAAAPGATVTYTITAVNTGQTPYAGATVTDDLSGELHDAVYNNDAIITAGPGAVSVSGGVLTWTGGLATGAAATITYSVTVNNPDTGGKLLVNTATSADAGSSCPPASPGPSCTATVGVLTPALTITKTADTSTTTSGGTVHYTITVANTGQIPYTPATFTDPLSGVLDDATYNTDAAATAGTATFASPTLTWTGNLAPGDSATITYSVTVHSPDTGNHILANTVTSPAAGSTCPTGTTRASCTATVTVSALTITNTADVATTTPGGVVHYTFTAANTGQAPIPGAALTAHFAGVFDDATYNGDVAATSGSVTISHSTASATWTGDLAIGAAVTITGSVTVSNPDTGDKTLTETADSPTPGSNCPTGGTDPACTATVTVLIPALTITKTASASTTTPGSAVSYTITIDNTGQTPYTGLTVTDDLTGVLGDATYTADATPSAGAVTYTAPSLTWSGDLAVAATVTITYSVTVSNPDTGDKHLINDVVSTAAGSNCPDASTNPACSTDVHDLIPALAITKTASTASAAPGATVTYTITATDTGQTPYTGATVTDDLTGVLDDATYNGDAHTTGGTSVSVTFTTPDLTWTGDLTTGATATLSYSVTISDPATGDLSLHNTVTSTTPGNNCPAANTDPACAATVFVLRGALSITVPGSAGLGAADPGGATSASLGTVQVTDNRALAGATWTATVAATSFTTGTATPAETIPPTDATYYINTLDTTTGTATFTPTPITPLSTTPQTVVTATNATGDTDATWNPAIQITVPAAAVAGTYTATITHSVS